jgi:toxin YoeB
VKIIFSSVAWEHYLHWQSADSRLAARINELIRDARRTPFAGIGKPEPLRNEMSGWWSRRITDEHRFVYRVAGKGQEQALEIAACRFHYGR